MEIIFLVGVLLTSIFLLIRMYKKRYTQTYTASTRSTAMATRQELQKMQKQKSTYILQGTIDDLWSKIPENVKCLLYHSKGQPKTFGPGISISIRLDIESGQVNYEENLPDDPSTIYFRQSVTVPKDIDFIPKLNYWPSYAGLIPEQKWIYLNWLQNINKEIDMGYVFIFYYGLERQLLIGEYDKAFDMILELRNHHKNKSFQHYSLSGLVYSVLWRNRVDKIHNLLFTLEEEKWGNEQLVMCAKLNRKLTSHDIGNIANSISGVNKRYIKLNRREYDLALEAIMKKEFEETQIDLQKYYPVLSLSRHQKTLYANYSFPLEVRTPKIPDYMQDKKFINKIVRLHEQTHETVKNNKAKK